MRPFHPFFLPLALAGLLLGMAACKPAPQADPAAAAAGADPQAAAEPPAVSLPPPKDAVQAAMRAFKAVRSYHATMDMEGAAEGPMHNELDYVAPDRYRMTMEAAGMRLEHVRIGNDMYMTMDGRTQKVTMPQEAVAKWEDLIARSQATMTVRAEGHDTVDGQRVRKYLVHQAEPQPTDVALWVNDDDLPVQARMTTEHEGRPVTTTIRYSRYDDPDIRIEPPQ